MAKVLIFIDKRENNDIEKYFYQYEVEIQKKMLICGDFLLSDRVVIERKTTNDFINSIIDKRIFNQLKEMKENFEKPLLIIEGNSLYGRLQPNIIRGVLAAITIDLQIPIIWTKDMAETAGMIYWIARREQFDMKREIPLRGKKSKLSLSEQQEFLIHGLPNISIKRSKDLLKYFKTPEKVFKASEKELLKVKGIGKGIAKKIRKILTTKYSK
ncbi:MAG: hypothetical protein J7K26_00905 [Candidatus Aenigmarchaeota archaeon]|nr:hypothetical protein [Candidatus Aenigmarchaeota archaeon]